jgi:hypothetical protein
MEIIHGKAARCPRPGCGRVFRVRASSPQGRGLATVRAKSHLEAHAAAHARRDAEGRSHDDLKPPRPKDRRRPEAPLWFEAEPAQILRPRRVTLVDLVDALEEAAREGYLSTPP